MANDPGFPSGTRQDEIDLWNAFPVGDVKFPYEAGMKLGISLERIRYLCRKWEIKGWYRRIYVLEYGEKINHGE